MILTQFYHEEPLPMDILYSVSNGVQILLTFVEELIKLD